MACTNYVYGKNWTQETFGGRIAILKKFKNKRGDGWVRDHGPEYSFAGRKWSNRDFIGHGWKEKYAIGVTGALHEF